MTVIFKEDINLDRLIDHYIETFQIIISSQDQYTDHVPNVNEILLDNITIPTALRLYPEITDLDQEHLHLIDNKFY